MCSLHSLLRTGGQLLRRELSFEVVKVDAKCLVMYVHPLDANKKNAYPSPRPHYKCFCRRELGFQVVEVNASDTRSKSDAKAGGGMAGKLSNVVREMVTSTALAAASGVKRRQVLVMDEVDGMSGVCGRCCFPTFIS